MLKELHVKNFAIIDDVKIEFGSGLNVLSGETGAGKTLIIEAINLLIGERADSSLIREGKEKLLVQGFFDLGKNRQARDYLVGNNILDEEDFSNDVVIARELNRTGKNKAFINGLFTQVSTLKELGDCFIDIHGQHDHQYLLNAGTHIEIVDNSAKDSIYPLKDVYTQRYEDYKIKKKKLYELKSMQENRDLRLQDLKFRYDEIDSLKITEGEEEKLENEFRILKNFESIYKMVSETEELIKGPDTEKSDLSDTISSIQSNMRNLASIDTRFSEFAERIDSLSHLMEEVSHFMGSYLTDFDFSRERLDAVQERLYSFSLIKKKYNIDISRTGEYLEKIKGEIDSYEGLESDIEVCEEELRQSLAELREAALELSAERSRASSILEEKIVSELQDLGFGTVIFQVKKEILQQAAGREYIDEIRFTGNGIDAMEFFISLNAGESPRPLKKIASGGEISRVMLAIKSALGAADNISTMVFDEIDSGIGGAISMIVGEKLFNISLKKQIIVISHLAQIACFSSSHYFINKFVQDGRTKIGIDRLDQEGKIEEVSRMLGGGSQSGISVRHARELIEKADTIKGGLKEETLKVGN